VHQIRRLDLNIAYACNLACKGCLSLSDFDRKGVMPYNDIVQSIDTWKEKINPTILTMFGGEPLLHPKLFDIIKYVKKIWPDVTIRLITNGYLLSRRDPTVWFDFAPFEIQVSVHRLDHEDLITKNILEIVKQKKGWKIKKTSDGSDGNHHMYEWQRQGMKIWKGKFGEFVIPYNTEGNQLVPFKSNPKKAHSICGNPNVPVLYKNKLYKCAPIANLLDLPNTKRFKYKPIDHLGNIDSFVKMIGKPESICSMCPETRSHSIDHYAKGEVYVKHHD
jgi:hypothetical protein